MNPKLNLPLIIEDEISIITLTGHAELVATQQIQHLLLELKSAGLQLSISPTQIPAKREVPEDIQSNNHAECEVCGDSMKVVRNYNGIYDIVCCDQTESTDPS